ncbi:MAG TPA: hypothetical protein VGO93_31755, partial [Candidatus Xenobia bacterium]
MRLSFPRVVGTALVLGLLVCVPALYRYSNDLPLVSDKIRHAYLVACIGYTTALLACACWTVWPDRWAAGRRSFTAVLATIFILYGADAVCGRIWPSDVWHKGLIFPPHSDAHYDTLEFSFDARVNSLGFRDREFDVARGKSLRILAVGDSTTYGWGVNIEQAWPKILEQRLRGAGLDVEVLDLGQPGTGPPQYADLIEKAVPLFH